MREMTRLLLAASVAIAIPASAQVAPVSPTGPASPAATGEKVVEGATAQRVDQVERCPGHKFDSVIEIDPVRKRSTRVKLCADPGASDADWVKTLEAAVIQIEQRAMPDEAKDKLLGQLKAEIAKFASATVPATKSVTSQSAAAFAGNLSGIGTLAPSTERFETSIVPPLPTPLPRRTAASAAGGATGVVSAPGPIMRFRIRCLTRGQSGGGSTCDFFDSGTILALSAVEGLDKGGTLRFRRKGEARGEVTLAPLADGTSVRVRLPSDLCRGVSFTRIELELLAPGSANTVAARDGPYEMRC